MERQVDVEREMRERVLQLRIAALRQRVAAAPAPHPAPSAATAPGYGVDASFPAVWSAAPVAPAAAAPQSWVPQPTTFLGGRTDRVMAERKRQQAAASRKRKIMADQQRRLRTLQAAMGGPGALGTSDVGIGIALQGLMEQNRRMDASAP